MLPKFRKGRGESLPNLVDEFFGRDLLSDFFEDVQRGVSVPAVNISEGKNEFKIEVAAPGLTKDDFDVSVDDNMLTISSEKEQEDEKKEENYMRREFSYSSFRRTFSLPEGVDADKIEASHKNGVLTIKLPKKEEAKAKEAKKIDIK